MAESIRVEHTFACSEDTFWDKVFFDEEYNRRMYLEALRFPYWRELSSEDRGDHVLRVVEVEPSLGDLPAALQKVVGEGLRYKEEGRFDKASRHYGIRIVPSRLADKIQVDGELFTQSAGEGQVKRIFTCAVSVKIFGVGAMLEKRLVSDLKRSYDIGAQFTVDFLKEKGLGS